VKGELYSRARTPKEKAGSVDRSYKGSEKATNSARPAFSLKAGIRTKRRSVDWHGLKRQSRGKNGCLSITVQGRGVVNGRKGVLLGQT